MNDEIYENVVGLVLARGGSVGIPLKNIRPLSGVPLLGWVLQAATAWKKFHSIWVSTENAEIAAVAKEFGAKVHWRQQAFAANSTSSVDATLEFLHHHPDVDILGLIQCTSPCLQPKYLEQAYTMMTEQHYNSVFAVSRLHKLRWKEVGSGESTQPMNFNPTHRPQRQNWPGELAESGMFYFTQAHLLLHQKTLQGGRCGYVEIAPEHCIDIDTPYDWLVAEAVVPKYAYVATSHQADGEIP